MSKVYERLHKLAATLHYKARAHEIAIGNSKKINEMLPTLEEELFLSEDFDRHICYARETLEAIPVHVQQIREIFHDEIKKEFTEEYECSPTKRELIAITKEKPGAKDIRNELDQAQYIAEKTLKGLNDLTKAKQDRYEQQEELKRQNTKRQEIPWYGLRKGFLYRLYQFADILYYQGLAHSLIINQSMDLAKMSKDIQSTVNVQEIMCCEFDEYVKVMRPNVETISEHIRNIRSLLTANIKNTFLDTRQREPTEGELKVIISTKPDVQQICKTLTQAESEGDTALRNLVSMTECSVTTNQPEQVFAEGPEIVEEQKLHSTERLPVYEDPLGLPKFESEKTIRWECHFYDVCPGEMQVTLGCVMRIEKGIIECRESVTVTRIDQLDGIFQLEPGEELVSNIIRLKQTNKDEDIKVEEPVVVAIPHCAPKRQKNRETRIKMQSEDRRWITMVPTEVQIPNKKEYQFVEIRLSSVNATLLVVTQPKHQRNKMTGKAMTIISDVDKRVFCKIDKGTYVKPTNIEMEVIPVDGNTRNVMETKYPREAECIVDASPFVSFNTPSKVLPKPIEFNLPITSSREKTRHRPVTAARLPSAVCDEQIRRIRQTDNVHLMVRDGNEQKWTKADEVEIRPSTTNDAVNFTISQVVPERFVVVKSAPNESETDIENAVEKLEDSLAYKMVQIIMGQEKDAPTNLRTQCVSVTDANTEILRLEHIGYDTTKMVSDYLTLREGQEVVVRFTGNIGNANQSETRYNFNSQIQFHQDILVKVEDVSIQKTLDQYNGRVHFFARLPNKDEPLCDFSLYLPKEQPDVLKRLVQQEPILHPNDLITKELLEEIATQIEDKWRELALVLGITNTRLQAIERNKRDQTDIVFNMLLTWVKVTERSADKVQILCHALLECNLEDIERDLRKKEDTFRRKRAKITRDNRLKKAFVQVAQESHVLHDWKKFARILGISESDLHGIDSSYTTLREKCLHSLIQWGKNSRENAGLTELSTILRTGGYPKAADKVYSGERQPENMPLRRSTSNTE